MHEHAPFECKWQAALDRAPQRRLGVAHERRRHRHGPVGSGGPGRPLGLEEPARIGRDRHAGKPRQAFRIAIVAGTECRVRCRGIGAAKPPAGGGTPRHRKIAPLSSQRIGRGRRDIERTIGRRPRARPAATTHAAAHRVDIHDAGRRPLPLGPLPPLPGAPRQAAEQGDDHRQRDPRERRPPAAGRKPPVERIEAGDIEQPEAGDELERHRCDPGKSVDRRT